MKFTLDDRLTDVLKTKRGRLLAEKHMPGYGSYPNADYTPISYYSHAGPRGVGVTPEVVEAMLAAVNAPVAESLPALMKETSLDEIDDASYFPNGNRTTPLDGEAERCFPKKEEASRLFPVSPRKQLSLDGTWRLAFDRAGQPDWAGAMDAPVPGSVHTALEQAGVIPEVIFGRNQQIALKYSYMDWWMRTEFRADDLSAPAQLVFEGIANRCEIYLNGEPIGAHEGMFGCPAIDVTGKLQPENELIVRLFAIPFHHQKNWAQDPERSCDDVNDSWRTTVVSNNVYGWHYSCLPSLGIWNRVRLEYAPEVALLHPFIATRDAQTGEMRMAVEYESRAERFEGTLSVRIEPENFEGDAHFFDVPVFGGKCGKWLYDFQIRDAKLWWPNGLGDQNLYRLTVSLAPDGAVGESVELSFGVRTVQMAPLGDGPRPDHYNWRFIVNGRPTFIRGTGWCTMDAMMDFRKERYDRFLKLAHIQNCQMIRAWGGGMPETDDFYALCDQYGIMVMQEWPTAWDSHLDQPYDMLEETVRLNTLRIRNHPSLIIYCPGNESGNPYGEAIDMMGRYAFELDGTRVFHRGEPFGGSIHNYDAYWGRESMDAHATLEGAFFGEFGIACTPCAESVNRYLPDEEKNVWPAAFHSAFEYHTPIFGSAFDLSRLSQMSGYFARPDCSFEQMTVASQLSQIVGVRHTLERARIRYPDCGGALYYKLNDNFPAMSWASVDWYGAPKLAHYVFQKSFAPTAAFILVDKLNFSGTQHALPIYVTDDFAEETAVYEVHATVRDGALRPVQTETFHLTGDVSNPERAGAVIIRYENSRGLLLVHVVLKKNGAKVFDTFYFFNYEAEPGCLFELPKTTLALSTENSEAVLKNTGDVPAIGAMVLQPGHLDTFTAWENFLWLDPGEERRIPVDSTAGLAQWALNA